MPIKITENGVVNYENSPDVNRKLFPNLSICGKEINELADEIDGKAPLIVNTASGSIASFDNGADDMPLKSCVVSIEPIQEGSGDPSPENVRPISGRTGLSVTRTGKNLLDASKIAFRGYESAATINGITLTKNSDGSFKLSGTATAATRLTFKPDVILVSGSYTLSITGGTESNLRFISSGNNGLEYTSAFLDGTFTKTYTVRDNAIYEYMYLDVQNGATVNSTIYAQLEKGSSATDYEPYKGNTYTVNWETEAGTVYGASLDVITGKLTVNTAYVLYDGSFDEGWEWVVATNRASTRLPGAKTPNARNPVICNRGYFLPNGHAVGGIFVVNAYEVMYYYPPTTVTNLESYLTWLSENNLQVVYELAEPVVYQLSANEIRTLLGENNIWSDAGDVSVESPADTKTYIDDLSIKTVEVSGQSPVITAEVNTRYICGEVTSLTFTPCEKGICDVRFTAASISTVLTLPETVKLPEWFDPTLLEANTTYEINIVDGVYGVVMSWA